MNNNQYTTVLTELEIEEMEILRELEHIQVMKDRLKKLYKQVRTTNIAKDLPIEG